MTVVIAVCSPCGVPRQFYEGRCSYGHELVGSAVESSLEEWRWSLLHTVDDRVPDVLVKLMRAQVLALMVIQTPRAGQIGRSEIARAKPTSSPPRPIDDLVGDAIAAFRAAGSNAARLAVIKETQDLVHDLRFAPVVEGVGLRRGTLDFKIAVAKDQRAVAVVAHVYGLTGRQVRAWRRRYGSRAGQEAA